MPRYVFKDLYVPSLDPSGSNQDAASDPLPQMPDLTINYDRIDFDRQDDEFVFKTFDRAAEAEDDRWIDIIGWDHGRETSATRSEVSTSPWETEDGALSLPAWELDTFL